MIRLICAFLVMSFVVAISMVAALAHPWLVPVSFVALTTLFVINGLRKIPASPPHKAILVLFGRRLEVVINEGWNFFPGYPFVFSFILVKVEKVNYDLESQEVRTPDNALISVRASITWIAGIEDTPGSFIVYLNSGGEDGVRKIIHDIIEDRVKTWARSNKEGPSTWMEAQAMKDDAHGVLAKSLLGDALKAIPRRFQDVPTSTWMRFFDNPKSEPTEYDASSNYGWAHKGTDADGKPTWDWKGLQRKFDSYSSIDQGILEDAINGEEDGKEGRRKQIRNLREGKAKFGDESLGITIVRFTVNEVVIEGEVAKAAELAEKEARERAADTVELENIAARAKGLRKDNPEMTYEKAVETVMIAQGKVRKSVIQVDGAATGLGQDGIAMMQIQRSLPDPGQAPPPANPRTPPPGGTNPPGGGVPYKDSADAYFKRYKKYPKWDPEKRTPN